MSTVSERIQRNISRATGVRRTSRSSKTSNFDINKQNANYRTRLASSGINPDDVTDNRNALEKLLNLEKDQNVLFDIFELIGRPQQALFGGIESMQEGGSFGEGAKEGITGERKTQFKNILTNAGMDDTEGQLDLADVLGFAGDVFLDPVDLALIPVTAGGSAAVKAGSSGLKAGTKALKAADTVSDVARTVKAVDKTSDALRGVKAASNISDTLRTGAKLADASNQITRAAVKGTTKLISPAEGLFRLAGKGAKGTVKLADKGLEKVLGKVDAKQLRNAKRAAEKTGQTVEEVLSQIGGKSDLLGDYKALKKGISNTIDSSKMVGGLVGKARRSANSVDTADAVARQIQKNLDDLSTKTAAKLNIDPEELSKNISKIIESEQDTTIDGLKWLNKLSSDNNVFEGTEKSVTKLKNFIQENAPSIKFKQSSTPTKLVIDTKKSKYLEDFKSNKGIRDAISKLGLEKDIGYTSDELKEINKLKETFENNKDLSKVLKEHRKGYPAIADAYKKYAGVDLDFARQKGYIRKAQGDLQKEASNVLKSDITGNVRGKGLVKEKTFGAREYDSGLVANRLKKEELAKQLGGEVGEDGTISVGKLQKQIESKERKLSVNRKVELENARKQVSESLEKAKNFDINATKLGEREGSIRSSIVKNQAALEETRNKLNKNTLKRLDNIKDNALHNSFSKHTQDVNKATKEYNKIIEKMSMKDVPDAELKKLAKQSSELETTIGKLNTQIEGDLARINGYVDKKTLTQINQTNNALKKTEGLGARGQKLSEALDKNISNQKILKQSNQDTITKLEKRLKDIDLQLGALTPERDKQYLKEIKQIQNKISILNSNEGKELFNLSYHAGMKDFIDNATQYSKGAKVYNDALVYGTFKNPDYIRVFDDFAKDGAGNLVKDEAGNLIKNEVPRGFVKIDGSKLQKQFEAVKDILPENSDALQMLGKEWSGKKLLVDRDFANLMNIAGQSKEQANALVKVIDGFNNMFKKYKILTPGFQVRNIAGNATNMVLSGMPANQIPIYYGKAGQVLNSTEDLLEKVSKGAKLTGKDADNWKILQQFYEGGFDKAGTKLQDLEQLRDMVKNKKGPLNAATKVNVKLNEGMDKLNRLSLLMYANDHPKYIEKLGKSNAIDAVKYALMDPSNMSDFEKTTMKKIIPFYTFTKQNLLFQATNMMKNTPRYNRLIKAINSTYSNLSDNEYFKYQKEGMQIPLPATDSNGNRLFLKTNLPLSDLGEWIEHPMQRTLSSTTPLIKTPYEMVTGKNIFTGADNYYNTINDLVETTTGKSLKPGTKNLAGKAEQILAGLGVDTISTNLVKKVTSALKRYNGDMDDQAMWAEILRSVLQNTNQEKVDMSKAYENMETYQEYIKGLKNQGIDVPTIRDINNQSKRSLRAVQRRRNAR